MTYYGNTFATLKRLIEYITIVRCRWLYKNDANIFSSLSFCSTSNYSLIWAMFIVSDTLSFSIDRCYIKPCIFVNVTRCQLAWSDTLTHGATAGLIRDAIEFIGIQYILVYCCCCCCCSFSVNYFNANGMVTVMVMVSTIEIFCVNIISCLVGRCSYLFCYLIMFRFSNCTRFTKTILNDLFRFGFCSSK